MIYFSLLTNGPGTMRITSCPAYMLSSRLSKQNLLANITTSSRTTQQVEIMFVMTYIVAERKTLKLCLLCGQLQQIAPSSG